MHRLLAVIFLSCSFVSAHEHQHFVVANQPNEAARSRGVIPTLDTKGDVYKTEGPNDFEIYGTTIGDKKLIMVYTHFKDTGVPEETTQETEQRMFGDGRFLDIFHKSMGSDLAFQHPPHSRSPKSPFDNSPSSCSNDRMNPPAPGFVDFFAGSGVVTQVTKHACVPVFDRVASRAGTDLRAARENEQRMSVHGWMFRRFIVSFIRQPFAGPPGGRSLPSLELNPGKSPETPSSPARHASGFTH